jgi:hypothetical protein
MSSAETLYHATTAACAAAILREGGRMRPGTSGKLGPAIYFASSPELARRLARAQEAVLAADVDASGVLVELDGECSLRTFPSGADCVRYNGGVYAVRDTGRIRNVRIISQATPATQRTHNHRGSHDCKKKTRARIMCEALFFVLAVWAFVIYFAFIALTCLAVLVPLFVIAMVVFVFFGAPFVAFHVSRLNS